MKFDKLKDSLKNHTFKSFISKGTRKAVDYETAKEDCIFQKNQKPWQLFFERRSGLLC